METTERDSAPATRRAGQVWSRAYSTCSGASRPKISSWNANKLSSRMIREQVGGEKTAGTLRSEYAGSCAILRSTRSTPASG